MKRYIALCAALCCLFTTGISAASPQAVDINIGYQETAAHSESCAYNWYCKHTKDLIQRMADEGHLICNHTASHHDMSAVNNKEDFAAELEALEKVCKDIANVDVAKYYRPPEGRFSEQNLIWANELGYKTVLWSYGYMDWDNNAQPSTKASYEKVLSGTHNGEVLLLHPTSATNAAILGDLIDTWKNDGFRFGTLDELCK